MQKLEENISFPKMEQAMLKTWQTENAFEESNQRRSRQARQNDSGSDNQGYKSFRFYDGPPFANGLPHYGHLLANTIKDCVPRYWNMQGNFVERRFGWDCHGVPVEYEIEKKHNLGGAKDIEKMGVAKFNALCRESVLHYAETWQQTITRLGRWVDWNNQYRTMDKDFMESVWWVFRQLHEKGLVYRGHKVVPYSPRITSVVSNFEANQNYKDTQDPALTVKFKQKGSANTYFLAWTTTPWTLISNLALAVNDKVEYSKAKDKETGEELIFAKALTQTLVQNRFGKKAKFEDHFDLVETKMGSDLVGIEYEPLFPYFQDFEPNVGKAYRIRSAAFVSTEDGTGIVHCAPAYGEDDFALCQEAGISLVDPVDDHGCFTSKVPEYEGLFVKEADKEIIKDLKERDVVFHHGTIVHSYPFCERTDTPLIYKAIPAWYVAVEKIKDDLVTNNQKINWVPGHLKDGRMGKWLENARDWAISRNRYWGTPIPIWVSESDSNHFMVIGSVEELESLTSKKIDDLHKDNIDELTFSCPKTGQTMKRIPEVFDCWFESGSMPYAQNHYPFENKESFDENFPADFIAEGLDQTRGWFYTLSVLSTALFNQPAFKNVIVNGIICDETGKKMSKRHRNYTPPEDLLNKYGSDSVRLYMLNSPILRGENLIFTDEGVRDTTRQIILPLWNAYSFLNTYATADGWKPSEDLAKGKLKAVPQSNWDKWILSRLGETIKSVDKEMQAYHLYRVIGHVVDLINDLTNWYIRLNRRRFWGGEDGQGSNRNLSDDQNQAYGTLYFVVTQLMKICAPFAPFVSDKIYRDLSYDSKENPSPESVHWQDFPRPTDSVAGHDPALNESVALVTKTIFLGRSLRAKHNLKTRQVLPSAMILIGKEVSQQALMAFEKDILGELNLKKIEFSSEEAKYVNRSIKPNFKTLGRTLGSALKDFSKELKVLNDNVEQVDDLLHSLHKNGKAKIGKFEIAADDLIIERSPKDGALLASEGGVSILLDTNLTPELIREGKAREIINRIQNFRKDAKLNVIDRIDLQVGGDEELLAACQSHEDYIKNETLANVIRYEGGEDMQHSSQFEIDGKSIAIGLSKA